MNNFIYMIFIITILQFTFLFSQATTPFIINDYTYNDQTNPSLVKLNNGNIFAFWQSSRQSGPLNGNDIYGSIFDLNGTEIVSDFSITDSLQADDFDPFCCRLNNGNILVCWTRGFVSGAIEGYIMVKIFDQQGNSITNEFFVNDTSNGNTLKYSNSPYCYPTNDGGYIISYSIGGYDEINIVHYDQNNIFVNSFNFNVQFHSISHNTRLTRLTNNNIVIVFESYDQNDDGIFFRILDINSGYITNNLQANDYFIDDQENPQVLGLDNGHFVVSWCSNSDSTFAICKIFNETGSSISSELRSDSELSSFGQIYLIQNENSTFSMVYPVDYSFYEKLYAINFFANGNIAKSEFIYYDENALFSISPFEIEKYNLTYDFLIYQGYYSSDYDIFGVFINTIHTSVTTTTNNKLKKITLEQNYPNPFNNFTTFKFSIQEKEFVEMNIFNCVGQLITTPISKEMIPGDYTFTWNASNLVSGIYYCKIESHSFSQTRKLLLLK